MPGIQAMVERANLAQSGALQDTKPPDTNNKTRNPKEFALAEVKSLSASNLTALNLRSYRCQLYPLSVLRGCDPSTVTV